MTSPAGGLYFIAGGTGGIGLEVAKRLRSGGAEVTIAARNEAKLKGRAGELGTSYAIMDATEGRSVSGALELAMAKGEPLKGVVNCIGSILLKPSHLTSDEDWLSTLHTNLSSSFFLLREAARLMMTTGGGSIVFCSTVAAQRGLPNHEAIAAAKAGVEGLTRSAAATYARFKIRVNCVAPGLVQTPLSQFITTNEVASKTSKAMHPLGRLGEPNDVASAICWLLSPEQSWVTGQVIHVDGGLSTVQAR